eukprot:7029895-Lingulodinium_polyedra.AAC.1
MARSRLFCTSVGGSPAKRRERIASSNSASVMRAMSHARAGRPTTRLMAPRRVPGPSERPSTPASAASSSKA